MKNTHLGKTTTQILSVLLCASIALMIACCFAPYYTITEPYHYILNLNPMPDHYSLIDLMWTDTKVINTDFVNAYEGFSINDYVTNMVLSFVFGVATIATSIWFAANELRRFPSMTAGVFTHICAILYGLFSLMGYISNPMLDLGVPKFMVIRPLIIVLIIIATVLAVARLVIWILTEVQLHKEKQARLALL